MFQRLSLTVFSFLSVALASFAALANDNIDAVIEKVRTPSYDCPNQSLLPELEDTLALESLTSQQRFALTVAKGQFLICRGQYEEAETILGVTAQKLIGGDITEDDALEILDNNMDNLQIMGFENKFDAMRSVYEMTDQFHKDINGGVE